MVCTWVWKLTSSVVVALALLAAALTLVATPASGSGRVAPLDGGTLAPGSHEPASESVSVPVPAGISAVGWFGLGTSSDALLAANASLNTLWTFVDGTWISDSTAFPDAFREPFVISRGTPLFIVADAATSIDIPIRKVTRSTTIVFESEPMTLAPNTGEPTDGESVLTRTPDGAEFELTANDLEAGHAYTVWWIIFNDPAGCLNGCGEDEIGRFQESGDNPANISVVNATGGVADETGKAVFNGRILVGDTGDHQVLFGDGLQDSTHAELHQVVRSHGPALEDPAALRAQTSTVAGGCGDGGFACFDPRAAVHLPSLHTASTTPGVFQDPSGEVSADEGQPVDGSATLTRFRDGAAVTITVNELEPNHAYTIWWIIFNEPAQCVGGCGEDDIARFQETGENPANIGVQNATGGVADDSGSATFTATLLEGNAQGHQVLFGPGLIDSMKAEIHNAVRSHGPASDDATLLEAQTTTVAGGCGEDGFACFDPFGIVHATP